jgi:hypothetical protein
MPGTGFFQTAKPPRVFYLHKMNGYELSRTWFDWCFINPEKINSNHSALYFFCIEHCNRLGWKEKFGLPTTMAKEAIGIKSYNTYIKTLNDLIEWKFIILVQKSINQYSSNIIALSKFNKALDKALDKALIKHSTKQGESIGESISSIDKQETINNEQETINNKEREIDFLKLKIYELEEKLKIKIQKKEIYNFDFINGSELKEIFLNWIEYKKQRKETYKTQKSLELCFSKLVKFSENKKSLAEQIINDSMANNYAGFFEVKINKEKIEISDMYKEFYKDKKINKEDIF